MRAIPLNILTLYADLDQSVAGSAGDVPATISRRLESGQRRIYAKVREGVAGPQCAYTDIERRWHLRSWRSCAKPSARSCKFQVML